MAKEKNTDIFFFQPPPPCHLDLGRNELLWTDLLNNKFKWFGQGFFSGFFRGLRATRGGGRIS